MSLHEIIKTVLTLVLLFVAGRHGWQNGKNQSR